MIARVNSSRVSGVVASNPSKSHAQRCLALAAMARGRSELSGMSDSADVNAAISVCRAICPSVTEDNDVVHVEGGLHLMNDQWHCGEAGFSFRMFTAIAGLFNAPITLTGEGSLTSRPVSFMRDPMEQLGARFSDTNGVLPVTVQGPFRPHTVTVDGSLSSQFLSGLIMSLPLAVSDSTLQVDNLKSTPYIDLTLYTMRQFGVDVDHDNYEIFSIPGGQSYTAANLTIEGDWSGMAFILVMGAIAGDVSITNLEARSTQADRAILEVLEQSGVTVRTEAGTGIGCASPSRLAAFVFDATDAPDLFPPLVSLAAHCEGVSRISGVDRLTHKESDRYTTLQEEFGKLGIKVWKEENTMCVEGGPIGGGLVNAHNDHRIAMALATAGLTAESPVEILGAECVHKSFPGFYNVMKRLGADIETLA